MGTARRQYTDEFKREALELLLSSGRPLSQIAGELGIPPERLRAWIWLPRMLACGARTSACAWSERS